MQTLKMTEAHPQEPMTPGQALDAVLQPFREDEARLRQRLAEQRALRADIQQQVNETKRELALLQQSMIDALRHGGKDHPLLAAAFFPEDASAAEPDEDGSHPLLKPAG